MSIGQKEVFALIKALTGQANILTVPRVFITMTGETDAALLLGQILYWSDRTTDPDGWFFKSAKEWNEELGLSTYKVNRAIKLLERWGVQTRLKKANGAPTTHYRLDSELFFESISKFLDNGFSRNSQNGSRRFSEMDNRKTPKSLTETTPEITSEIPSETTDDVVAALSALGLTKRQATGAVKRHQLTVAEVAQWRDWKASLKKADNATAMLAALIKEQRLPPREERSKKQRPEHDSSFDSSFPATEYADTLIEVRNSEGTVGSLSAHEAWNRVLVDLLAQIPRNDFETWIKPSMLLDVRDGSAIVAVPNIFVRQEIESQFLGILQAVLGKILGYRVDPEIVIGT